jgi:hypothetical protein
MKTTIVYDTITGVYIQRVPIYERGLSCRLRGLKHLWVLNTAHKEACIRCGLNSRITSFYKFAVKAGLLESEKARKARRRRRSKS